MANSIFPDIDSAGGEIIRDAAGNCLSPPEVTNAYCPPPAYVVTCDMTALPNNCDARIEPRQINAIISELVSFAECLDPNGPWNCDALNNICAAFTEWVLVNRNIYVADTPPPAPIWNETIWWESDTGYTYIAYNDGNTQQWIQIAGGGPMFDQISIAGTGSNFDPHFVNLLDCGTY